MFHFLNNRLHSAYRYTDTLVNSGDPVEMPLEVAFHQGLHFLQRSTHSSGTEMYHNLEISIYDP